MNAFVSKTDSQAYEGLCYVIENHLHGNAAFCWYFKFPKLGKPIILSPA
jgi:hypothetical protein